MNFIIFYSLFTYCAIRTSRAAPSYFQIEEFIKQLMTSEKFDELTDVIAEKAAQKIINMESQTANNNIRQGVKTKNKPRFGDDHIPNKEYELKSKEQTHFSNEKESRSEEKSNYDREKRNENDSRFKEKSHFEQEKNIKGNSRSDENKYQKREKKQPYPEEKEETHKPIKFGKIDTQKVLKNHMTSKELELNFKHLTEELEKHRFNIKENNPKTQKGYGKDKHGENKEKIKAVVNAKGEFNKSENLQARNENSQATKNDNSKELKVSQDSSYENAHEQANFHDAGENKSTNDSNANDSIGNEETKRKEFNFKGNKIVPRMKEKSKIDSGEVVPKSLGDDDGFKTLEDMQHFNISQENENKEIIPRAYIEEITSGSQESLSIRSKSLQEKNERKKNGAFLVLDTSLEDNVYHDSVSEQKEHNYINI